MLKSSWEGRAAEPRDLDAQPKYLRVLLAKLARGFSGNPRDLFFWLGELTFLHFPSIRRPNDGATKLAD